MMKKTKTTLDFLEVWKRAYPQINFNDFDPLIINLLIGVLVKPYQKALKAGFNFDHFCTTIKSKALTNQLYQPNQIYQAIWLATTIEKDYFRQKYPHDAWKSQMKIDRAFKKHQSNCNKILKKQPLTNAASHNAYKLFQKWWVQNQQWQIFT